MAASDVAREIRAELPDIDRTSLHKLLYFCQGHHLADTGHVLFGSTISCWDHGPVVGTLWRSEQDHSTPPVGRPLDSIALQTVGYVVSRYGNLPAGELEALTHQQSPWRDANARRATGGDPRITVAAIQGFFVGQAERERGGVDRDAIRGLLAEAKARTQVSARVDDPERIRSRFQRIR